MIPSVMKICSHIQCHIKRVTILLKNAELKTTQLGLFGNTALGKYWTEHMLGNFDPASFYSTCWAVFKSTIV